ncbi:hypothetical protein HRS9122_08989 [Pyrenophora teres f. teres]|nr:hypothetical protein HRS9122_08989 [Pyrenophora teres f. teres]
MPQWLCQECRWPSEEAAETCTQCNQSTRDGNPGMTDGSSSEEEEDAQSPMSDEVPQEYQLEQDGNNAEEEYDDDDNV